MKASEVIKRFGDSFSNPICLVNLDLPDQPLVYVNDQFCTLTAYKREEIIGQNCRFLQGPLTDKDSVLRIREAIRAKNAICQDLINYNAFQEIFYNRLVLVPYKEESQNFFIGLQHEISKDIFKGSSEITTLDILDKTMNPLAILVGLLMVPTPDFERDLKATTLRIKNYILSL